MTYATGHIKRDPETGAVAVRTIFPEDQTPQFAAMAWLVASTNIGARNASSVEVAGWDDLFVPQDAQPEAPQPEPPAGE